MDPTSQIKQILENSILPYIADKEEGWLRFMRDELRYIPDKTLIPIVVDIANFRDTAVRSCHGVGKTTLGANVLLTALTLVPDVMVIQLSPTWSQVRAIFWNELRKWWPNSKIIHALFEIQDKAPNITSKMRPHTWYAAGVASNSPGKIEGRHARRVLMIGDEMKSVEDSMVEGIQGALTSDRSWRLYLSTPSTPGGRYTQFYNCFTKNRSHWKTYKITADESPRVSKSWVERMIREYGADSQIVKARVFAEFPDASGDILISLQSAEAFYKEDIEPKGYIAIGVDVARYGDDESVITVWKGETLININVFDKKSVTQVASLAKDKASEYGARVIVIDDIGIGGGVTDILADSVDQDSCTVVPFIANGKSKQPERFQYLADEVLWEFANAIKTGVAISSVNDERLVYQLSSYRIAYTADNRISVKWPEKRGDRAAAEKSPDRGDAAWLGWYGARLLIGAGYTEFRGKQTKANQETDEDLDIDLLEFHDIRNRLF
jgi:hypothetical protein